MMEYRPEEAQAAVLEAAGAALAAQQLAQETRAAAEEERAWAAAADVVERGLEELLGQELAMALPPAERVVQEASDHDAPQLVLTQLSPTVALGVAAGPWAGMPLDYGVRVLLYGFRRCERCERWWQVGGIRTMQDVGELAQGEPAHRGCPIRTVHVPVEPPTWQRFLGVLAELIDERIAAHELRAHP